jgi:hypothetical protein
MKMYFNEIYLFQNSPVQPLNMTLFGSGINFYGGPGESAHKQFIKIP